MDLDSILLSLDLTKNERIIYKTVLNTGKTKANRIIKLSKLHSSKVYEGLQRLIEKGLISYIIENKIKNFQVSPISSIKEILNMKSKKIEENKKLLKKLLPDLQIIQNKNYEETDIRVYRGWEGMKFIYEELIDSLNLKDTNYVLGASKGEDEKKTKLFFEQHLLKLANKKIKQKIIYNLEAKENIKNQYKFKSLFEIRYIPYNTPVEFNLWKNTSMLVFLKKNPIIIVIKNKEIYEAFKIYFDIIWNTSMKS